MFFFIFWKYSPPYTYDRIGYVSSKLDKDGRAVMYLKVGRNIGKESADTHQKFLMYTVERYVHLAPLYCMVTF